jgi:hypothetical protein
MTSHSDDQDNSEFIFRVLSSYKDYLSRQVAEAIKIHYNGDVLLNSKNEYIPTASLEWWWKRMCSRGKKGRDRKRLKRWKRRRDGKFSRQTIKINPRGEERMKQSLKDGKLVRTKG